jgi:hypothetical protein
MQTIKDYSTLFLLVLCCGLLLGLMHFSDRTPKKLADEYVTPSQMCFYEEERHDGGLTSVSAVKFSIDGDKISGEVKNLPAEKDSKVGDFNAVIVTADNANHENIATGWWDARAEGSVVREELTVSFGPEEIRIFYGEMEDRGDGVYMYKDRQSASMVSIERIDCNLYDYNFENKNRVE